MLSETAVVALNFRTHSFPEQVWIDFTSPVLCLGCLETVYAKEQCSN